MNIFVWGIHFKVEKQELKTLFEQYGTVSSAKIITKKNNEDSMNYGFVKMPKEEEAKLAIEGLDKKEFMGNILEVREATKKK